MTQSWENLLSTWAKPPATTEQDRCENTERAIHKAISQSEKLKRRTIKVSTQGSYRNNTNVRRDSDVDICVLCTDVCFVDYAMSNGLTDSDVGLSDHPYSYAQFKNEVGEALTSYFGAESVSRGNKAFNIRENSYHVEADAAPFFEHRRYNPDRTYLSGVQLIPDNGGKVINWPDQHYRNGVNKNTSTNRRFKALVRILKALCNHIQEEGITATKPIPGFLIECLVWNVPNPEFGNYSYLADLQACLAFLFNNTVTDEKCTEWGEVSELKYLFRGKQKWTRQEAHNFISAAWDYLGFE
jgi:hypothetical protein